MTSKNKPAKKKEQNKKKVTSKDVPGSGMARKAAEAIERRQAKRQKLLHNI